MAGLRNGSEGEGQNPGSLHKAMIHWLVSGSWTLHYAKKGIDHEWKVPDAAPIGHKTGSEGGGKKAVSPLEWSDRILVLKIPPIFCPQHLFVPFEVPTSQIV